MLTEYPQYKKGDLEEVFSKLPKTEKETINEFVKYCSIGAGENKLLDMKRTITQFRHITQTNFNNLTLKHLRDFLALLNKSNRQKYTTNGIKTHLKRFLRWKFKDWSARFEELKDIKTQNAFNHKKINEGTLLSKDDIKKIMKSEPRLFWKTFFICLYESGCRPIELRTLTWKNINFNVEGDVSEVHIYSTKTGKSRTIYIKEATAYLQKLKEKGLLSELVFPSPRDMTKPLTKGVLAVWLKNLSLKALGREVFPYLLRHSRATELYLNNPKVASKFLGHSKDMSDLYTHLSTKDVKDNLMKTIYKLEEDLPPEKRQALEQEIEKLKEGIKKISKAQYESLQDFALEVPKMQQEILKMIFEKGKKFRIIKNKKTGFYSPKVLK